MNTTKINTLPIDSIDIDEISEVKFWHSNDPTYTWGKPSISKGWNETILCEDGSLTDRNILLKPKLIGKRDKKALLNSNRRAYGDKIRLNATQQLWSKGEILDNENSIEVTPTWIIDVTFKEKSPFPSKYTLLRNEDLDYSVFVDLHKFLYIQQIFKSKRNTLTFHISKDDISTSIGYHNSLVTVRVNGSVECLLMPLRPFITVHNVDYRQLLKDYQESLKENAVEEIVEEAVEDTVGITSTDEIGVEVELTSESSRRNLAMKCWDWVGIRRTRYLSR